MVSRLCFGTEPFAIKKGPDDNKSQGDLTAYDGGTVLKEALKLGVNFWDTSDDYGTHPHVKTGLSLVNRDDVIVADKSNALTFDEGNTAVELSLASLETDYVDLLLLHNVPYKSAHRTDTLGRPYISGNLDKRLGALKAWVEAKDSDLVRAIGLSTHNTRVLKQTIDLPEVEVICTTLNLTGKYVESGSLDEHLDVIRDLHDAGKGIYVIKLLHAGRIVTNANEALRWAFQFHEFIDSWNIGMYNINEVSNNLELLEECIT